MPDALIRPDVGGSGLFYCAICGRQTPTEIVDSRPLTRRQAIRRRRMCNACGTRFTTYETTARPSGELTRDLVCLRTALSEVIGAIDARIAATQEREDTP